MFGSNNKKKPICCLINSPDCSDTMELYNEMMEAKQSRSQDSQSELDVLCSEIDSEGENYTSSRSKRKKQNALHQSNKRVGLENQKYTSSSWRQQCVSLLTNFFQCDDSTPFRHPVNLTDYPDYRNIIDIPMDLSTVQERVNSNHYSNPAEFCKDMRLIFQNSRNYNTNKKSRIYSMTIRLSAMFEEHIRSIISDWRSAVKYEEKIRNNQFVSNRRKPILLQEPDVNIGASTSRSITQNSILSRHLRHAMNSVPESSSSRGHMNRLSNGLGKSKKKTKEEPQSSRGSAVHSKKKNSKPAIGVSLTNGARKSVLAIQKRNNPVISPKNLRDRSKRKDLYEENSQSDSNNSSQSDDSSENDEEDDTDWNHKSKRPRRDSPPPKQKSLRSRNNKTSLRPTRSSYQQPLSSSSSLRSHNRTPLPRSRSSSPDDRWAAAKKRTVGPPLHKRSKRLCNSTIKKPVYKDSDPSSDSEEESESQSFKSDKNSNSSNSSSKFSRARAQTRISQSNDKIRQSDSSSESEPEHNENPRPDSRRTTRVTGKSVRVGALSARLDRTPRKSGRIVTRNRGARTVQYQEGNSDESENDVSRQSSNSRGSLRSLMNDDEQKPWNS
ncbi:bromodomain and WD repeat-containing protein 1 [Caerostris extrusa]|uniref:Bromodomain and WD repeat-containing protein 1 n=1 Tax=Caerostris extrusa TaxID=172846 RepID=A0AAV4XGW7_CAEEX|nr:bromodomain and WD repeat-containing protein 1 [Caerostris extrusa]